MRAQLRCAVLLLAASYVGSPAALGELTVLKDDGSPATAEDATIAFNPDTGGWSITLTNLYNEWGETIYDIHGNGCEVIDAITIGVDGPPAGSPLIVRVFSDSPFGIGTIHSIIQTGDAETLLTEVQARDDIGAIQADSITFITAGRDVIGPIIATTGDNETRGVHRIDAGRDVLGDVIAPNGKIGLIVAGRNIGAPGAPAFIAAKYRVIQLVGYSAIYADVNARFNEGDSDIFAVGTPQFHGTINARRIIPNPSNGVPGRIIITEVFEGAITLGGAFDDPEQWIELPGSGPIGQIVFNADGAPNGAWTAPVYLGPEDDPDRVLLQGPHYSYPAAQMGGGAVGLVPFALHDESCEPAGGASVSLSAGQSLSEVRLRHYGPVIWADGPPVSIARRAAGGGGAFSPVPGVLYRYEAAASDPNTIVVRPLEGYDGFEAGYEYRLEPSAGLLCDVSSALAVQWDEPYSFTVEEATCTGDVDGDGLVGIDDLVLVIGNWGPASGGNPADVDGDGVVGIDDLLLVINHWGPCPGGRMQPPRPPGRSGSLR